MNFSLAMVFAIKISQPPFSLRYDEYKSPCLPSLQNSEFTIKFADLSNRGEPNRGYKEPNPNPNILSLVLVSYNRIRIVQKGIPDTNIGFLYSF